MRHGYHYTPCKSGGGDLIPFLLIVSVVAAVVFWPTVVAVTATVLILIKIVLIAGLATALAGAVTAIGVAVHRQRRSVPTASVLAVQPAWQRSSDQLISEQLAVLTAAVERLADQPQAAWADPTSTVVIDQQTLAASLAELRRLTPNDGHGRREVARRWDG